MYPFKRKRMFTYFIFFIFIFLNHKQAKNGIYHNFKRNKNIRHVTDILICFAGWLVGNRQLLNTCAKSHRKYQPTKWEYLKFYVFFFILLI